MFRTGLVFLFIFCISVTTTFSQNKNIRYIILNSGDTIWDIKILKRYKLTNKRQVSYVVNNSSEKKTQAANAVLKYFDGNIIYYSEPVNESDTNLFIDYFADGFCKAGLSYTEKGEIEYFLYNSKQLISLKNYLYNLSFILEKNFDKFNEFSQQYKKEIKYDYKSLGEFISAYNAFLYPEIYKKEKYKYKQSFNIGINIFPYNYNISIQNSEIALKGFQLFNAGFCLENKVSGIFSSLFFFTVGQNKYYSDWMTFNHLSYKFEGHAQYHFEPAKRFSIIFSPGIAIRYNYSLSKNYDYSGSSLKTIYMGPFSFDYILDVNLKFNNRFKYTLGFNYSNLKIINQGIMSKPEYINGKIIGFRLGVVYNFKLTDYESF